MASETGRSTAQRRMTSASEGRRPTDMVRGRGPGERRLGMMMRTRRRLPPGAWWTVTSLRMSSVRMASSVRGRLGVASWRQTRDVTRISEGLSLKLGEELLVGLQVH